MTTTTTTISIQILKARNLSEEKNLYVKVELKNNIYRTKRKSPIHGVVEWNEKFSLRDVSVENDLVNLELKSGQTKLQTLSSISSSSPTKTSVANCVLPLTPLQKTDSFEEWWPVSPLNASSFANKPELFVRVSLLGDKCDASSSSERNNIGTTATATAAGSGGGSNSDNTSRRSSDNARATSEHSDSSLDHAVPRSANVDIAGNTAATHSVVAAAKDTRALASSAPVVTVTPPAAHHHAVRHRKRRSSDSIATASTSRRVDNDLASSLSSSSSSSSSTTSLSNTNSSTNERHRRRVRHHRTSDTNSHDNDKNNSSNHHRSHNAHGQRKSSLGIVASSLSMAEFASPHRRHHAKLVRDDSTVPSLRQPRHVSVQPTDNSDSSDDDSASTGGGDDAKPTKGVVWASEDRVVGSDDNPYGRVAHRRRRTEASMAVPQSPMPGHMRSRSEPFVPESKSLDVTTLLDANESSSPIIADVTTVAAAATAGGGSGGALANKLRVSDEKARAASGGFRNSIARYLDARASKRNVSYRKMFDLPDTEQIVVDWQSSLVKSGGLLHSGRLYISQSYFCFYSNIFGIKTRLVMPISDIVTIKKGGAFGVGGIVAIHVRAHNTDEIVLKKHKFVLMGINVDADLTVLRMVASGDIVGARAVLGGSPAPQTSAVVLGGELIASSDAIREQEEDHDDDDDDDDDDDKDDDDDGFDDTTGE